MSDNQRLVYFRPQPDISLRELVNILLATMFQEPGRETGIYSILPPDLQRHFELREISCEHKRTVSIFEDGGRYLFRCQVCGQRKTRDGQWVQS